MNATQGDGVNIQQTIGHMSPNAERAEWWLAIFGSLEVPLISPVPQMGTFPDKDGGEMVCSFYNVDLDKLDAEQIARAVTFVVNKFGLSADEVRDDLAMNGMPILAQDVSVSFDARLVM